jgi:hypothetical protein
MILLPQITPKTGLAASVQALFANNEQGAWYDPSDSTTLFQNSTGTTPVTAVEQPVSLMLDKSKSLVTAVVVVTNGDFATDSDWTKGTGWTIGSGVATKTAGTAANLTQTILTTAGQWYKVTATITRTAGGITTSIGTSGTTSGSITTGGTYTWTILAGSSTQSLTFAGDASFAGTVDNVSVQSIAGNHAYTPSTATASRPVLSSRYNLLIKTEQFDDVYWNKAAATTVTPNTDTAPDGTLTADTIATTSSSPVTSAGIVATNGAQYRLSVWLKKTTGATTFPMTAINGSTSFGQVILNTNTGVASVRTGIPGATSLSVASDGDYWKLSYLWTSNTTSITVLIYPAASTDGSSFSTGLSGSCVAWGASLTVANDGVGIPYQRVNTSTDYDSDPAKFPRYLRFDRSDDYMLTNSVDYSGGDSISVSAALRKDSDAALGVALEHSATIASNNGTFLLSAPNSAAANFNFSSKGTTAVDNTVTTYTAPISAVIVANSDISDDVNNIRINGGAATAVTTDQGSGNFGNFPMYIGRRGGTANPFGGRLYGLIARAGSLSEAQATSLATYLNTKSKIY